MNTSFEFFTRGKSIKKNRQDAGDGQIMPLPQTSENQVIMFFHYRNHDDRVDNESANIVLCVLDDDSQNVAESMIGKPKDSLLEWIKCWRGLYVISDENKDDEDLYVKDTIYNILAPYIKAFKAPYNILKSGDLEENQFNVQFVNPILSNTLDAIHNVDWRIRPLLSDIRKRLDNMLIAWGVDPSEQSSLDALKAATKKRINIADMNIPELSIILKEHPNTLYRYVSKFINTNYIAQQYEERKNQIDIYNIHANPAWPQIEESRMITRLFDLNHLLDAFAKFQQ
ncbi:4786_t:CDS:2 [Gigaspora margarita]|uniref:4786_t:CDS:1 n=1 Tax=Gigaspora margarita TaxID=4874 RepID=A0ABN7UQA7_GIGMA|nr:4786_t:CDS:2 [Gigaspora margarita]